MTVNEPLAPTLVCKVDTALRALLSARLSAWPLQAATQGSQRRAAVALVVIDEGLGAELPGMAAPAGWSTAPALVLTRRALTLTHHPGQWALPGGRIDLGETPEQAALRELREEVGLVRDEGEVLGRLDDFITHSGFCITPVVVWGGEAPFMVANAAEVASIHRVPLSELMRADAPLLDPIDDSPHPVLRMPVGHGWVAAPTAALLYQFREVCLAGRATRVSHFEQPHFARR